MRPSRPSHVAIAIMVAALVEGQATVKDIAGETGLSEQSTRGYLRAMRKRRAVHVSAWEHDINGRQTLAAYSLGRKPDAPKVAPRSRSEIAKHYRARVKMAQTLGVMT